MGALLSSAYYFEAVPGLSPGRKPDEEAVLVTSFCGVVLYGLLFLSNLQLFLLLQPGPNTTLKHRHCRCNHLTSFSSDLFVPPNKIDWGKISFEELLRNPLVFSVVCGIFGLYFLLILWARRADRKDLEKVR